ncbi:MAG: hypothetical protein NC483_05270 [Ruminococcus sp.]|nr:hypothetical protein [Ruminococcus sp.]
MKFERNINSKKYFLCGLIMVVVLTVTVTFITSKANYRMTASIPLTEGKVISSSYDINVMAVYINDGDGNYQELSKETTIPTGYTINKEETYCCKGSDCKKENKDTNAVLETIGGIHTFRGISKGDKCFIYIDKDTSNAKTMNELLTVKYKGRYIREDGEFNSTVTNTTMGVIYEGEDDDGITYYFAGNPLDNWVEFGGYYWRIIRINGDGSIRLIYQGRTEDENGNKLEPQAIGEETQIGTSAFNELNNDNTYIGFMYGTPSSSTYEDTHSNVNKSVIMQVLEEWYNQALKSYSDYIDLNAGFCNDRKPSSGTGVGSSQAVYTSRLVYDGSRVVAPTYKCPNSSSDLFTFKSSTKGNKKLDVPIGLITADEIAYAGSVHTFNNTDIFLYTGKQYWTISPSGFYSNKKASVAYFSGPIGRMEPVSTSLGVRPVINLRSDVQFTGDGTQFNPFKAV